MQNKFISRFEIKEQYFNKIKKTKYHTFGTFSKFNINVIEIGKIDILNTHIHDSWLCWLGICTPIERSGGVTLVAVTLHALLSVVQCSHIFISWISRHASRLKLLVHNTYQILYTKIHNMHVFTLTNLPWLFLFIKHARISDWFSQL